MAGEVFARERPLRVDGDGRGLDQFKQQAHFEAELAHAEKHVDPGATKVLVLDGARSLWKYIEEPACFKDYEKMVDFFHAAEHLSAAAEALFGKQSRQAEQWYKKHRSKLRDEDLAAQAIVRSIDYYSQTLRLSKSRRKDMAP